MLVLLLLLLRAFVPVHKAFWDFNLLATRLIREEPEPTFRAVKHRIVQCVPWKSRRRRCRGSRLLALLCRFARFMML